MLIKLIRPETETTAWIGRQEYDTIPQPGEIIVMPGGSTHLVEDSKTVADDPNDCVAVIRVSQALLVHRGRSAE